jgi:hypothetical protein
VTNRTKILGLAAVALASVPVALGAGRSPAQRHVARATVQPIGVVVHVVYDGQGTSTETDKTFPPQGGSIPLYTEATKLSWHMAWDLDLGGIPKKLYAVNLLSPADAKTSYVKGSTAITTNVDPPCNAGDLRVGGSGPPHLAILGPKKGHTLTVQVNAYDTIDGNCRPASLFTTINPLVAGEPKTRPFAKSFKLDLDYWEGKQAARSQDWKRSPRRSARPSRSRRTTPGASRARARAARRASPGTSAGLEP